ncbi:hypothetical protein [Foetidibacter luteolus]|uniref:hypothetical protein n=1 Tax=Foetidibacter luteolus TaxID=2608880 RepID=UPI00129A4E28|nr:hypothetical protein [Foetidibacter luteolus]
MGVLLFLAKLLLAFIWSIGLLLGSCMLVLDAFSSQTGTNKRQDMPGISAQ